MYPLYPSRLRSNNKFGLERVEQTEERSHSSISISHIISVMRRHAIPFFVFCVIGLASGIAYVITAKPLYTATVHISLDNRQVRALHDVSMLSDAPPADSAEIESQVEVLRSEKLGLTVVKQLNLSQNPAFAELPSTWTGKTWESILATFGMAPHYWANDADPYLARQLTALTKLESALTISRVGRTYVLQVAYTGLDPVRAAEIVNTYADAYMSDQLNSRIVATRRARSWLKQRSEELRELSIDADLAAQKFKADNNLLSTKGILISEQQFNEMTTQLVNEKVRTTEAEAQYRRIKKIIDDHETDAAVSESLADPVINELRTKYLDAAKRFSDLEERKLDPTHAAVVILKNSMAEYSRLLFQELGRVAQSYRNDYEVAAARSKVLADNLEHQQRVAIAANDAQAQLRQLEQKAESYKTLYQTYMQRYQEAAQQESFSMTDSHIISPASPPLAPSHPRKSIALAASLVLGALAGFGFGLIRELKDRVFRTAQQARNELGVDVLGLIPVINLSFLPKAGCNTMAPIMRYVIDDRFSAFAETLRSTKAAVDLALHDRPTKLVGFVSLLPNEGKSTLAKNYASLIALQGAKTLLIDADTRNPGLTRAIGCDRKPHSPENFATLPRLTELLQEETDTGLQILPSFLAEDDPRVADGLSAATIRGLLMGSAQTFEYVIIDLPPIGPLVNARSLASAIDAFIFIIEWGETSRGAVQMVLANEPWISDKLLGVILNKVDMKKLKVYESFDSDGYYHPRYDGRYKRQS
jgi:succinoglycan biosynthesis transport protein ExoP